jgi:opacity protein-like surface antigen
MKRATLLALALYAAPAFADDALTIPPLKIDEAPSPSVWNGLYVGSGVTFAAINGRKGAFGGDVFAGYDKRLDNNFVLGVKLDTGFAPFALGRYQGFDYALGSVKLGYDFGRVTPYLYAGGGLARATAFASELPDASATLNGLFGQGPGRAVTTFGGGVDYRLTNNVTVGVSAGVFRGPGGF